MRKFVKASVHGHGNLFVDIKAHKDKMKREKTHKAYSYLMRLMTSVDCVMVISFP